MAGHQKALSRLRRGPVRIERHGWRWALAQWVLRLLYGRPWHYISPWEHASVSAKVVLVKEGKALLGRRRGNIEHPGIYDTFGGHVDIEAGEDFLTALRREVLEETGINLREEDLPAMRLLDVNIFHECEYFELASASNVCLTYLYEISEEELEGLRETEEAHDFAWFCLPELEALLAKSASGAERREIERAMAGLRAA